MGGAEIYNVADFDPRPIQFRNAANYKDHFHNTFMKFAGISKTPIFQTFEQANMYAFSNDHDYFSTSHEQNFLNHNKITQITPEECDSIEVLTRGQNTNDRWNEEREKRIQSSNYHRICTATEKVELSSTIVQGQSETMRHGCKLKQEHHLAGADRSSIFLFKGVGTYLNFYHKGGRGGVERGL
ncbi:hypothetical protein DPMN_093947 [Dreissena polymorpha]|uniref:Uncharacterized protein n=1 Tax=Dreissena polymorpha TaxID=45954 RepID=A0A9D4L3W1_DREPO|nr:hypothetical protein DPMN_093947 [Dreissena polymorpha]